jgi:Ca2+/Na+ antiporter
MFTRLSVKKEMCLLTTIYLPVILKKKGQITYDQPAGCCRPDIHCFRCQFIRRLSKAVAMIYAVPVFVLAIIITPIATELPEKFNSVIWISREKDTLALGNITGAMVFQSSLIPAIGILLTDWQLTNSALISALLALLSAGLLFIELKTNKHIRALYLLIGGFFYAIFLAAVFAGLIR